MKTLFTLLAFGLLQSASATELERRDEKDANLYSSFGKRDPFKAPDKSGLNSDAPVDPLRKFRLEGYRLRAILRTGSRPQAMFEDPEGRSHVVVEGSKLGLEGARVSRIVNSEVIVTERSANYLGKETLLEKVISLPVEDVKGTAPSPIANQQSYPERAGASVPTPVSGPSSPGAPVTAPSTGNGATPSAAPSPSGTAAPEGAK